jgi:hypothetical protein
MPASRKQPAAAPAAASRPAPLAVPPATPRTRGTPARRLRPRVARAKRTRRKTRTCARPDEDEDEDERDLPTAPINKGISLLLQGDWDANLVCRILTVPRSAAQAGQAAGNRQARVGAECMLPHACARAQEQLVLHQRQRPRHVRLMLPATCSAPCLGRCRPRAPSTVARGGAWPDSERHVRSVEGGGRGRARARRERACAENSGQACCILRGMSRQLLALTCRSAPGAVTQESGSTERWGSKPNRERAERE